MNILKLVTFSALVFSWNDFFAGSIEEWFQDHPEAEDSQITAYVKKQPLSKLAQEILENVCVNNSTIPEIGDNDFSNHYEISDQSWQDIMHEFATAFLQPGVNHAMIEMALNNNPGLEKAKKNLVFVKKCLQGCFDASVAIFILFYVPMIFLYNSSQ